MKFVDIIKALYEGIQWTLTSKLEDLAFVDDLALLSHRLQDMQEKVRNLETTAQKVGLKIGRAMDIHKSTTNECPSQTAKMAMDR